MLDMMRPPDYSWNNPKPLEWLTVKTNRFFLNPKVRWSTTISGLIYQIHFEARYKAKVVSYLCYQVEDELPPGSLHDNGTDGVLPGLHTRHGINDLSMRTIGLRCWIEHSESRLSDMVTIHRIWVRNARMGPGSAPKKRNPKEIPD